MGVGLLKAGQADQLDELGSPLFAFLDWRLVNLETEFDILGHRAPRKQDILLEHDSAVGAGFVDFRAIEL